MIMVRIEVWPYGDEEHAEPLGKLYIANTGAGTLAVADYDLLLDEGSGRKRVAVVRGYERERGWLPLLREALAALEATKGAFP
jgi:hypothetical protein